MQREEQPRRQGSLLPVGEPPEELPDENAHQQRRKAMEEERRRVRQECTTPIEERHGGIEEHSVQLLIELERELGQG